MNIKGKILILMLFIVVFSTVSVVMADNGKLVDENTVIVNQSGENISYEAICVDKDKTITIGTTKPISNNITIRDGAIEYIVDNYHNTSKIDLQNGIWNITENNSIPFVEYPDFYTAQKLIETEKVVTIEEINGSNYTVTRWSSESWDFIFRMMGDGHGKGFQDLLLYTVDYLFKDNKEMELIPPIPIDVNNSTNITNETNITNNTNITNETPIIPEVPEYPNEILNPETITIEKGEVPKDVKISDAIMKETGIPLGIIGALIIAILGSIGFYRRK